MKRKGIYALLRENQVVYIGQSKDMLHRIDEHIHGWNGKIKEFDSFDLMEVADDDLRKRFEAWNIKYLNPIYNIDPGITWGFEETDEEIEKLRNMHLFLNARRIANEQINTDGQAHG